VALAGEVMLGRVDDARAHVDQALDAFGQILRAEEQTVTVDGTAHELRGLAKRLRALRDDVAAEDDRAE
jgi:hypothetical protein